MNQNCLVDSAKSPSTSVLNPTLATALASLEVQLDQELTRYKITRNLTSSKISLTVENCTIPEEKAICNDTQILIVNHYQQLVNQEIENDATPTNLENLVVAVAIIYNPDLGLSSPKLQKFAFQF